MSDKRIRVYVTGKVQGVFFRQALKVKAKQNNILGWVKNLDDGRVEILIEGDHKCVESVVEWCNFGPANSRVDNIEIGHEDYSGKFKNFEVKY